MAEENGGDKKTIRGKRSPNYPIMTLEKSLEMVRKLYDTYQQNTVPAPLAMEAMGYSIKSGRSVQMMASLSYYGLIDAERGPIEDRKISVTKLGFMIIKHPDLQEREKAIVEAALKPAIFKKIVDQYQEQLPQDRLLEYELVTKYEFNPKSTKDFIAVFRQTMDFAKVYEMGIIEDEKEIPEDQKIDEKDDKKMHNTTSLPISSQKIKQTNISMDAVLEREIANYPIRGGTIRLLASGPVTQKAIDKLIKMLELSKEEFPENDQPIDNEQ